MKSIADRKQAKAESLDAELAALSEKSKRAFITTCCRVARGESPPTEIQAICQQAGQSLDVFRSTVALIRRRMEAVEALDDSKRQAEIERFDAEQRNLAESIRRLDAEHQLKRKALSEQYVKACAAYQGASSAASWARSNATRTLRETAGDLNGNIEDVANVRLE